MSNDAVGLPPNNDDGALNALGPVWDGSGMKEFALSAETSAGLEKIMDCWASAGINVAIVAIAVDNQSFKYDGRQSIFRVLR